MVSIPKDARYFDFGGWFINFLLQIINLLQPFLMFSTYLCGFNN